MMRWAVAMRTKRPSLKAFKEDFDNGDIIRLHLLRGTWQLVSGDNYWWMLDLCGDKCLAVIKGWMHSNRIDISEEEHRPIRELFAQVASDGRSVTKEDFALALAERDIDMTDQRLSYHIRMAELGGVLCSGDLHPNKATYSLTEQKIKNRTRLERDEALARLARLYFQSHSPATFEDFVWWTGMNTSDCRKGIELLGNEIVREKHKGREFLMLDSCRTRGFRKGSVLLIAPYDEYLIGYKSRDIVLAEEHKHHAHNNSGIFYPIIASDGVIKGNWSPSQKELQDDYFEPMERLDGIEEAWQEYLHFKR